MTEKELRRLKRVELLEIMLEQGREIERLQQQVTELKAELDRREIIISKAGSIAEAAMQLTDIFQEAQRTADLYLANVIHLTAQTGDNRENSGNEQQEAQQRGCRQGGTAGDPAEDRDTTA